jgi:hypothetical protein
MSPRPLLVLSFILARTDASAPAALRWTLSRAGTQCSTGTGTCRTFAHLVFTATPADGDVTRVYVGGADYKLDGSVAQPGGAAVFERHLVSGTCDGTNCTTLGPSLMFNWGYEVTRPLPTERGPSAWASFPKTICARVWLRDAASPGDVARTDTWQCVDFAAPLVARPNGTSVQLVGNAFSTAATSVCDARTSTPSASRCRTNLHVVYTAASTDATSPLTAAGEYSLDEGATWQNAGSTAFYEQHIDLGTDGVYRQAMQYDLDLHEATMRTGRICYRIRVSDGVSGASSAPLQDCLRVCNTLVPFHNPAGYCPSS